MNKLFFIIAEIENGKVKYEKFTTKFFVKEAFPTTTMDIQHHENKLVCAQGLIFKDGSVNERDLIENFENDFKNSLPL